MTTPARKGIYETSLFYFKSDSLYPDELHRIPQNSWKLTEWITKYSTLKGTAKLLSIQIAGYYNPKIGYSFPEYEDLMRDTGLSHATVGRYLAKLKLSGEWLILSANYHKHLKNTNNRYYYLGPTREDKTIYPEKGYISWEPKRKCSSIKEYQNELAKKRKIWKEWNPS